MDLIVTWKTKCYLASQNCGFNILCCSQLEKRKQSGKLIWFWVGFFCLFILRNSHTHFTSFCHSVLVLDSYSLFPLVVHFQAEEFWTWENLVPLTILSAHLFQLV